MNRKSCGNRVIIEMLRLKWDKDMDEQNYAIKIHMELKKSKSHRSKLSAMEV